MGYLCLSSVEETCRMATILTCYYRPKPGGLCKRFFRATESLLSRGHEVHYLAVVAFPISHPHCHFHRFPWPQGKTEGSGENGNADVRSEMPLPLDNALHG